MKARDHYNSCLCLMGFVKDNKGVVVKKIDGCIPAKAQNYTVRVFSLVVHGVGNHTYRLFPDNNDGKPNEKVRVRDIAVLQGYSLGDLENVPAGGLTIGNWSISPESFSLASQGTETVVFSLPLMISSRVPISVSDATEVVLKDGEYTKVSFTYTLGYTYDGSNWWHFEGHVSGYVPVTMDAKTVAADYVLSGVAAVVRPSTVISIKIGVLKLSIDPGAIIWNSFLKPFILELT